MGICNPHTPKKKKKYWGLKPFLFLWKLFMVHVQLHVRYSISLCSFVYILIDGPLTLTVPCRGPHKNPYEDREPAKRAAHTWHISWSQYLWQVAVVVLSWSPSSPPLPPLSCVAVCDKRCQHINNHDFSVHCKFTALFLRVWERDKSPSQLAAEGRRS
jgi:hypothetical protein